MLRKLFIGWMTVLGVVMAVAFAAVLMGYEVPKETSYEYRLEHGLVRGSHGRYAYTLGPRGQRIYDDPKMNETQSRLCLSGRIDPSACLDFTPSFEPR